MTLTIISVLILAVDFIFFIAFVAKFLGNINILFGFNNFKQTEAVIIGFRRRGMNTVDNPTSSHPIIKYYNEFLNMSVEKELINSGILHQSDAFTKNEKKRVAFGGEKVKIQYTNKQERVIDEKFTKKGKYNILNYILPIIISVFV